MNKCLFFAFIILMTLITGCGHEENAAIMIGDIPFTAREFDQALGDSRFAGMGEAGRRKFLEDFISTKLILKEAEARGLDKDPGFLHDIQNYWEQGLLKLTLTEKMKESAAKTALTDADIEDYYRRHKDTEFAGKEFRAVYPQIKWLLMQDEQRRLMAEWVDSLRTRTQVTVDYPLLGISG